MGYTPLELPCQRSLQMIEDHIGLQILLRLDELKRNNIFDEHTNCDYCGLMCDNIVAKTAKSCPDLIIELRTTSISRSQ